MLSIFEKTLGRLRQEQATSIAPEVKAEESAVVVQSTGVSRLTPKTSMDEWEFQEYCRVATALQLEDQGAFATEKLLRVLIDEHIQLYKTTEAIAFLNKELGDGKWEWRGLRKIDAEAFPGGGWKWREVRLSNTQYSDKVPLAVLLSVEKIARVMPETRFFISSAENGDPFLMVTTSARGSGCFLIERWDEPNFRQNTNA